MTAQKLNFAEVEQKSQEWKDLRYQYLTSTDVKSLLDFKQKNRYYTQLCTNFLRDKARKVKRGFNQYVRFQMEKGVLYEETLCKTPVMSKKIEEGTVLHGKTLVKDDMFLVSFDFLHKNKEGDDFFPIEVKYTNAVTLLQRCVAGSHEYYYQLAMQMYALGAKQGILHVCYVDKDGEQHPPLNKKIDITFKHYVILLNEMQFLKNMFRKYKAMVKEEEQIALKAKKQKTNDELERLYQLKRSIDDEKKELSAKEDTLNLQLIEEMQRSKLNEYTIEGAKEPFCWRIENTTRTKETPVYPYKMHELKVYKDEVLKDLSKFIKTEEITQTKVSLQKIKETEEK